MKTEILRLNLLSPLLYAPDESKTPGFSQEDGERIFCYELEEAAARQFEPNKTFFPGALVFAGKIPRKDRNGPELPPGNYVFSQIREILDLPGIVELAVEVQNEGLWQRLNLDKRFYVRFLFEDCRGVTQIWRPWINEN